MESVLGDLQFFGYTFTEDSLRDHVFSCDELDCIVCGVVECPYNEPLHRHHDSCPSCSEHQTYYSFHKKQTN